MGKSKFDTLVKGGLIFTSGYLACKLKRKFYESETGQLVKDAIKDLGSQATEKFKQILKKEK